MAGLAVALLTFCFTCPALVGLWFTTQKRQIGDG